VSRKTLRCLSRVQDLLDPQLRLEAIEVSFKCLCEEMVSGSGNAAVHKNGSLFAHDCRHPSIGIRDRGERADGFTHGRGQERNAGIAGQSASREAARRRERLQQARASRSRIANTLLGPSAKQKQLASEEKRWATGARGDEILAGALAAKCPDALLLHDRRIPKSRANIDHIAVTATGVYVIDAKRYRGKIEVRSPLFGKPKLVIAGRDRTKLVAGLERQVDVVEEVVAAVAPQVAVHGCFCFVAPEGLLADVGLPVMRTLKINGLPLYYVRRLAKQLNLPGPLTRGEAELICDQLARQLVAA
jgi:hypothetical protein